MKILKKICMVSLAAIMAINVSSRAFSKNEIAKIKNGEFSDSDILSNYYIEGKDKTDNNYTEEYKEYLKLSDKEKGKLEVIPRKYKVSYDEFFKNEENKKINIDKKNVRGTLVGDEETIPSNYDLREHINVQIENQEEIMDYVGILLQLNH